MAKKVRTESGVRGLQPIGSATGPSQWGFGGCSYVMGVRSFWCISIYQIMFLFFYKTLSFPEEEPSEPEIEGKFTFKKPTKRKSEGFNEDQVKPAKKKKEKKERTGPKQTKSNKTLLSFGDEEEDG